MILPVPVDRYLVPDTPATAPLGFTRRDDAITRGLPHTMVLDDEITIVLAVPNGLAITWRDADPSAVVTRSKPETEPAAGSPREVGAVAEFPVRFLVRRGGTRAAAVRPVLGTAQRYPRIGGADRGVAIEIIVLSWDIRAGTLRGAGDFGSRVAVAWRRVDRADDLFSEPVVHPGVVGRNIPGQPGGANS